MIAPQRQADARRGTKRTCLSDDCSRRFYDLNKMPTDCPYCGTHYDAPPLAIVDPTAYVPRSKARQYKVVQDDAVPYERALIADVAVEGLDEASAAGPSAEEIPEIEDEELVEEAADLQEREAL